MDSTPRSELATMSHRFNTIRYDHVSIIARRTDETCFNLEHNSVCSTEYLHITNEDGSEIDRQVLDSIDIELNRQSRFNLSGFESRHFMADYLPHPVRDNSTSQNLYYIAFNPPPQFSTLPLEPLPTLNVLGVNLGRIDTNHMTLTYNPHVPLPPRIKITIMRRLHNVFRIGNGTSGYDSAYSDRLDIRTDNRRTESLPVAMPNTHYLPSPSPSTSTIVDVVLFVSSDTIITIPLDDNFCVITLEPIEENADIVQCQECRKLCLMSAMNEWFKVSKTCPHCRVSGGSAFIAGKGKERGQPAGYTSL